MRLIENLKKSFNWILPFGILFGLASAPETGLLSLFSPGISGKQPVLTEYRLEATICLYQRPGNAVSDGTALPRYAATSHFDHNTILIQSLGKDQRAGYCFTVSHAREYFLIRGTIDNNGPSARRQPYLSYCRLTPAGPMVVSFFIQLTLSLYSFSACSDLAEATPV